jgi:hypothetical protein
MRNVLIIGIVVACVESAWSLSYMGPPTSQMMPDHIKLGLDYSRAQTSADLSGSGGDIDGLDTDLYLARLDYGIHEAVDFYGRLGIVEIEELGSELAWGFGIKSTVMESEDLNWGVLFQVTSTAGSVRTLKLDIFEIQLAGGPVWKVDEAVSLYGGPFLHLIGGEMERRGPGLNASYDIEQASLFGIYAGISIWATNKAELHLEYQKTADADAMGVGILFRY